MKGRRERTRMGERRQRKRGKGEISSFRVRHCRPRAVFRLRRHPSLVNPAVHQHRSCVFPSSLDMLQGLARMHQDATHAQRNILSLQILNSLERCEVQSLVELLQRTATLMSERSLTVSKANLYYFFGEKKRSCGFFFFRFPFFLPPIWLLFFFV